ncbi:MAG TPA: hypothetical protein VL068_12170 [Microthrixaceae bacterium]|nr:hypothetical protein [Microthrixaceae bacterium]
MNSSLAPWTGNAIMFAEESFVPLGDDFLPWIVLAFGAAMVVGNVLALVRPPASSSEAAVRPPMARVVAMIAIGAVAAIWGLASLLS